MSCATRPVGRSPHGSPRVLAVTASGKLVQRPLVNEPLRQLSRHYQKTRRRHAVGMTREQESTTGGTGRMRRGVGADRHSSPYGYCAWVRATAQIARGRGSDRTRGACGYSESAYDPLCAACIRRGPSSPCSSSPVSSARGPESGCCSASLETVLVTASAVNQVRLEKLKVDIGSHPKAHIEVVEALDAVIRVKGALDGASDSNTNKCSYCL